MSSYGVPDLRNTLVRSIPTDHATHSSVEVREFLLGMGEGKSVRCAISSVEGNATGSMCLFWGQLHHLPHRKTSTIIQNIRLRSFAFFYNNN